VSPFYHSISIANIILSIPNSFLFSSHPFYHFLSIPCFIIIYPTTRTSTTAIYSPTSTPHIAQYCNTEALASLPLYTKILYLHLCLPYLNISLFHSHQPHSFTTTYCSFSSFLYLSIYATDHPLLAICFDLVLFSLCLNICDLESGFAEVAVLEPGEGSPTQHVTVRGQAGVTAGQHCPRGRGFPSGHHCTRKGGIPGGHHCIREGGFPSGHHCTRQGGFPSGHHCTREEGFPNNHHCTQRRRVS
jgi:hypothetical protein